MVVSMVASVVSDVLVPVAVLNHCAHLFGLALCGALCEMVGLV